jgi:hypothetical protein
MLNNIALEPLVSIVNLQSANNKSLLSSLKKARKILRCYAESRGTTFSKLRLIDVCDDVDRRKISPHLLFFLTGFYKNKKQITDVKSRLNHILKNLSWTSGEGSEQEISSPTPIVPDFMKPVLPVLPRHAGGSKKHNNGGALVSDVERRLKLPLSDAGQRLLTALLATVEENKIEDLDSLFLIHRPAIYRKIREVNPPHKHATASASFTYVRRRLGYPEFSTLRKNQSIPLDRFPPKLHEQVKVFLEKAPLGLENEPLLRSRAEQKGIKVMRLEQSTIDLYLECLSCCLGKIKFDDYENIDIRSLLKIDFQMKKEEDGEEYTQPFNTYIDQLREIEMFSDSKRKEKGYDSAQFGTFLTAVKSIAVFNGIFYLHELFNKAYTLVIDKNSRKIRKETKKRVFDLKWIDSEITRLGKKYDEIIKTKSYKIDDNAANFSEDVSDLRFCLFYVNLVVLRYMGFRQQCLRNCEVGRNVFFESGGVIRFHWTKDEIKNDRELSARLDPKKHKASHGVFIDVLNKYYRHVYAFIRQQSEATIKNQLFVRRNRSEFNPFDKVNPSGFHANFASNSKLYMDFGDRLLEFGSGIHPHFFRGLCSDWLVKGLGLGHRKASSFIGDSERTFSRDYVDSNLGYDAGDALDEANENLRIRKNAGEDALSQGIDLENHYRDKLNKLENYYRDELNKKDALLQEYADSLKQTQLQVAALLEIQTQSQIRHQELMAAIKVKTN